MLRHLSRMAAPPRVIVVSADPSLPTRIRSLHGGAADYLTKPFEPEELVARIEVAMRERALYWNRDSPSSAVDPETGLGSRAFFGEVLAGEAGKARAGGYPLTLAFLRSDDVEKVAKAHGPEAAKCLLEHLGQALRELCGRGGFAARLEGPEFALILPRTSRTAAQRLIQGFRNKAARSPVDILGRAVLAVEISVGLAVLGEDAVDEPGLRLAADESLRRDVKRLQAAAPPLQRRSWK